MAGRFRAHSSLNLVDLCERGLVGDDWTGTTLRERGVHGRYQSPGTVHATGQRNCFAGLLGHERLGRLSSLPSSHCTVRIDWLPRNGVGNLSYFNHVSLISNPLGVVGQLAFLSPQNKHTATTHASSPYRYSAVTRSWNE